tara:strand:+ start:134 stop:259 length:126 start_codon:yes stop_codon:yes gene_type:complete
MIFLKIYKSLRQLEKNQLSLMRNQQAIVEKVNKLLEGKNGL